MSTTALAEPPKASPTIKSMLLGQQMKDQIALALPKHLAPERFIRIAITALTRTPKLAECEQPSFFRCLLDLSAMGLEPDGRRAHLIPFENRKRGVVECQLIVDFKGLIELAKRSGDVKSWRAERVCERDEFGWRDGVVSHAINWREDRGKAQCYYSHVTLADGTSDFEVMTLTEVEAIRKRSRAAESGPWVTDFDEMAKKTVIRRHSKRLTLSPEFRDALDRDDDKLIERAVNGRVVDAFPSIENKPAPFGALAQDSPPPAGDLNGEVLGGASPVADVAEARPAPVAEGKAPARRTTKPKVEALPLTVDNALEESAKARLERRVQEFLLDRFLVDDSLEALRVANPTLDEEQIAATALSDFDSLREACQS